jgi:hypothetical protein
MAMLNNKDCSPYAGDSKTGCNAGNAGNAFGWGMAGLAVGAGLAVAFGVPIVRRVSFNPQPTDKGKRYSWG